jgi:hypothetical protein
MTARDTMTVKPLPRHRQQVRNFALVWTGITLLIGACTFISIYAATGIVANNSTAGNRSVAPVSINVSGSPSQEPTAQQVVAVAAQTTATLPPNGPPPTNTSAAAPTLVSNGAAPADAATAQATKPKKPTKTPAPTVTPTINPMQDTAFDLGIAVQDNPSRDANVYGMFVDMAANQLRLNWVKSQIVWRDVEKVKGQIDWTDMDISLPALHKANLKVMVSIAKAPDWARDPGAPTNKPGELDGPPAHPEDYANFISQVLKRYPGMIQAIEVWNEINLDREWATAPQQLDPKRYVTLLQMAHDTIKAIDPNIIIITAALSPTGANNGVNYIDDFVYMDKLIAAGMLNYTDCVGAHHNGLNVPPNADYQNVPERNPRAKFRGPWDNPNHSWAFKSTLEGYATRVKKAGSTLKLCITEFGWPTAEGLTGKLRDGFGFVYDNTAQDQADFTDQAINLMQQWGFVRLAFVFNLNYGPQAGWSLDGGVGDNVVWSIIGKDWQNRPVWQKIVDHNFRGQPRQAGS